MMYFLCYATVLSVPPHLLSVRMCTYTLFHCWSHLSKAKGRISIKSRSDFVVTITMNANLSGRSDTKYIQESYRSILLIPLTLPEYRNKDEEKCYSSSINVFAIFRVPKVTLGLLTFQFGNISCWSPLLLGPKCVIFFRQ